MTNPSPNGTLILFDLVATLTDAGPRYARAFTQACRDYGIEPPPEKQILKALGNMNLKQIVETFAPGLPPEQVEGFMGGCNQSCDRLLRDAAWTEDLFPGVRTALESLKKQGFVLGVYTGTREDALTAQLEYHDIAGFFEPAYIRAKDNARDGFMDSAALKATQIAAIVDAYRAVSPAGRVIVIGDSVADYRAACSAGLSFIGFAPGLCGQQAFAAAGVSAVFGDYDRLGPHLRGAAATPAGGQVSLEIHSPNR